MKYPYTPTNGLSTSSQTSTANTYNTQTPQPLQASNLRSSAAAVSIYPIAITDTPSSEPTNALPVLPVRRPAWRQGRLHTSHFDSLYGSTDWFYKSLVDPLSARPSEIFSCLANTLFFWMDFNCDIAGLQSTGVIEPEKYVWMTLVTGTDLETITVLDHCGWLHASVFEARADPEESWKYWSTSISLLNLINPLTSRPFPSPLPRSSLPTHPVPSLRAIYTSWQIQMVADMQRQRSAEMVQQAMANARTQVAQMYQSPYVGAAAGLGATAGFGGGGGGLGEAKESTRF
ncbi:hypothetical protein BC835DRAFT_1454468 [Cytidiella melzeri]|nr:hypothetical protein BC835DRAFT_1454468 [Cytidiella melzeri]